MPSAVDTASGSRDTQQITTSIEQPPDMTHETLEASRYDEILEDPEYDDTLEGPEYQESLDPRKHGNASTKVPRLKSR